MTLVPDEVDGTEKNVIKNSNSALYFFLPSQAGKPRPTSVFLFGLGLPCEKAWTLAWGTKHVDDRAATYRTGDVLSRQKQDFFRP